MFERTRTARLRTGFAKIQNVLRVSFQTAARVSLGSLSSGGALAKYAVPEVKDAFRYMSQGKHSGKVLVAMPEGFLPPVQPKFLTANRHLITGGLGGFVLPAPSTHDSLTILKAGGAV